jgi:ADP-heptose:LPS heptosyltransferase
MAYNHEEYEVYNFSRLLSPLLETEGTFDSTKPFLHIPREADEKARRLLQTFSLGATVAVFPGSSINERKWGADHFHETAALLCKEKLHIIVIGGKRETTDAEEIVADLPGALNLCGSLSLPETAAVLRRSSLLITGDSGIMHMAYGLGVKIVALFGPGREIKWAPRDDGCIVINKKIECSPCTTFGYTQRCKKEAECMQTITVEEVFAATMTLLRR